MVKITIDTDNAAFDGNPTGEIVRILRRLADEIRTSSGRTADHFERDFDGHTLFDINGNSVGEITVD